MNYTDSALEMLTNNVNVWRLSDDVNIFLSFEWCISVFSLYMYIYEVYLSLSLSLSFLRVQAERRGDEKRPERNLGDL